MKTYLFDTINRYKRFSEHLYFTTTLCNKSWWVFNDEGVRSLYIFQPNGDLYVTTKGVGIKGSWQNFSVQMAVIINIDNKVMMFHPDYVDENILILTLNGTQNCAFLIDENNKANFSPKNLSDITKYLQDKEQKEIEDKRREEEALQRSAEEQEKQRAAEEQAKLNALENNTSQLGSNKRQSQDKSSSNKVWKIFLKIIKYVIVYIFAALVLGITTRNLAQTRGWSEETRLQVLGLSLFFIIVVNIYKEWDNNH